MINRSNYTVARRNVQLKKCVLILVALKSGVPVGAGDGTVISNHNDTEKAEGRIYDDCTR